jgi:hypothetical protein
MSPHAISFSEAIMVNVGYLTSSDLTDVTDGASLSNKTAHAYNAMRAAHPQVHIAGRYGGYRSAFTQNDMRKASQSPYGSALRAKYGLNPRSSIAVAAHPNGTHEWGDRVDLVGDTIPNLVNIAARYGFHREFGAADPNHFKHDGVTAVSPPAAAVKQVKPGRTIATLTTGKPNTAFYKRLQWYAAKHGTYKGPIDGKMGVQSWKGVQAHLHYDGLYNGLIDGKPGVVTYKALQTLAKRYGYKGPIDGKLGAATYRALAKALNAVQ